MTAGHYAPLPPEPAPGLLLRMLEARALWEHYATVAMRPLWSIAPRGDGHPVLVLPGLTAGDASTAVMRSFLKSRGFSPSGWGQGLNLGLREGVIERVHERMRELWVEHGRAVSLVGWSLGGLYARELAKHSPEMVRLCITLGSPFTGHPRETNAWRIYELASGHRVDWHDFTLPLRWAPPVPTTSIWSPTDGVVPWRCCLEPRQTLAENIVVEFEPSRARGASGRPLRHRRPAGAAGRALGAVPTRGLAAPRLLRSRGVSGPSPEEGRRARRRDRPDCGGRVVGGDRPLTPSWRAASSCRPCRPRSEAVRPRSGRSPGSRSWR